MYTLNSTWDYRRNGLRKNAMDFNYATTPQNTPMFGKDSCRCNVMTFQWWFEQSLFKKGGGGELPRTICSDRKRSTIPNLFTAFRFRTQVTSDFMFWIRYHFFWNFKNTGERVLMWREETCEISKYWMMLDFLYYSVFE